MINTMLIIDDLKFVLIEECPKIYARTASQNVQDVYGRWMKANDKTRAYILASLTKVLTKKYKNMITAYEIMDSLREIFGKYDGEKRELELLILEDRSLYVNPL